MKSAILLLLASWTMEYASAASGVATYYGGNLNGNACGMSGTASAFQNKWFAATGGSEFNSGYGCGKCYKITCKGPYSSSNTGCTCGSTKTITVQAIDQCPECPKNQFDLNQAAFAKIVAPGKAGTCGKIKITYSRVDCTKITGNFYIKNKSGTSKSWYGFHLNDVNDDGGIKKVELRKNGKKVGTCNKSNGPSFWLCKATSGNEFPNTPLGIKITSDKGRSVVASNCITSYSGGKTMKCNTNLKKGSGFTEEEEATSTVPAGAIVAIILVSCIIIGVAGFFFIRRRKQNRAVSFKKDSTDAPMQDGNDTPNGDGDDTAKTGGYDMSPINADTPGSTTMGDNEEQETIEIDVEVEQKPTPAGDE